MQLVAFEIIDQCDEIGRCQNRDRAGPCRLTAGYHRTNQTAFGGTGADRRWQHARDGGECSVERQFAKHGVFVQFVLLKTPIEIRRPNAIGRS